MKVLIADNFHKNFEIFLKSGFGDIANFTLCIIIVCYKFTMVYMQYSMSHPWDQPYYQKVKLKPLLHMYYKQMTSLQLATVGRPIQ